MSRNTVQFSRIYIVYPWPVFFLLPIYLFTTLSVGKFLIYSKKRSTGQIFVTNKNKHLLKFSPVYNANIFNYFPCSVLESTYLPTLRKDDGFAQNVDCLFCWKAKFQISIRFINFRFCIYTIARAIFSYIRVKWREALTFLSILWWL